MKAAAHFPYVTNPRTVCTLQGLCVCMFVCLCQRHLTPSYLKHLALAWLGDLRYLTTTEVLQGTINHKQRTFDESSGQLARLINLQVGKG